MHNNRNNNDNEPSEYPMVDRGKRKPFSVQKPPQTKGQGKRSIEQGQVPRSAPPPQGGHPPPPPVSDYSQPNAYNADPSSRFGTPNASMPYGTYGNAPQNYTQPGYAPQGGNQFAPSYPTQSQPTQYTAQYPANQYPTQYPTSQHAQNPVSQYPTAQYPSPQYPSPQYPNNQYPAPMPQPGPPSFPSAYNNNPGYPTQQYAPTPASYQQGGYQPPPMNFPQPVTRNDQPYYRLDPNSSDDEKF